MALDFTLAAGNGPFERFWLTTDSGLAMKVEWSYPTPLPVDHVRYLDVDLGLAYDAPQGVYYIAADDWGGGNLIVFADDDGLAAFIAWASDGATSTGYYRPS